MKHHALAFLLAAACVSTATAGVVDTAQRAAAQETWSAWGGDIGFKWNLDLAGNIGLTVTKSGSTITKEDFGHRDWFALRQSGGLQFTVINNALQKVAGGSLQSNGGYVLNYRGGSIDLSNFTLRPRPGTARMLDFVGSDGKVWLYSDHIMFRLIDSGQGLKVETADIRVTPELADLLGAPEAANWSLGSIALDTEVYVQGTGSPQDACNQASATYPWPGNAVPGVQGASYTADLFMQTFDAQFMRCQGCDGPGGTDGNLVFAPDSSLINNVNNGTPVATVPGDPLGTSKALYAGNIAWNAMFSGSPPNYNAPYKNDQHPYLIWNMYRTNADGSIEQIGRSGVKHAFLTVNVDCQGECYDGNSNGRGCEDTYATGNNDYAGDLGPRSEIVPATAIWGRCGSIWDPNCTGSEHSNGNNDYSQRLQTHESQIDTTANPGATYAFETWYIARQDVNIYNSMATRPEVPHYNSGSHTWSLTQGAYRLGPQIDRWVDPTVPSTTALNSELANTEGHTKVAVKTRDNGDGTWTYDYAVMNLDFARAVIQSQPANAGPDPRVISNKGFDSFSVPIPAGAVVSSTVFRNGVVDGSGAWAATVGDTSVTWAAGAGQPTLDWGVMYSFSITVNASPQPSRPQVSSRGNGNVTLHVATAGTPATYTTRSLVPLTLPQ